MCSSPPEKAQKSQLAVEQPPAGGYWNLQKKKKKKYPTSKDKKDTVRQ